ncbi:MAG: T9SS type A sorting domain-containing protein [bacterium]|nr:T9SS type A sorting domain-containing protein [bacterium]
MNVFIFIFMGNFLMPVGYNATVRNSTRENVVQTITAKSGEDTLYYDGVNVSGVGLYDSQEDTFGVICAGVRFTPMVGETLIAVIFCHRNPPSSYTGTFYLYGNGTTASPGTQIMTKPYDASGDSTWNRIDLPSPIFCDADVDFWAVLSARGRIGDDAGPMVADREYVSLDQQASWKTISAAGLNKNWNIRAILRNYTAIEENKPVKNDFAISYSNNPIKTDFSVSYSVPNAMNVKINLFDLTGRLVQTLENRTLNTGTYNKTISTESLETGVYFCNVEAGNYKATKKIVLVK